MQYINYLGIDVSKKTLDCCLYKQGKKVFDYKITNDKQGLQQLPKKLKSYVTSLDKTLVCAEKTGIYTYDLLKWMGKKDYNIWLENALAIKKSLGIVRGKNDKIDAQRIALYAMRYQDKYLPSAPLSEDMQTT
jgi:transposase